MPSSLGRRSEGRNRLARTYEGFSTASESPVSLPDVPHVERVHVIMTELLFGERPAVQPVHDPH